MSIAVSVYLKKHRASHENEMWIMWHGAVLPRMEKIPPLSVFLEPKKDKKKIDESAIIARLKAYQKRRGVSGDG